jgi:hypothetical protein
MAFSLRAKRSRRAPVRARYTTMTMLARLAAKCPWPPLSGGLEITTTASTANNRAADRVIRNASSADRTSALSRGSNVSSVKRSEPL